MYVGVFKAKYIPEKTKWRVTTHRADCDTSEFISDTAMILYALF